MCAEMKPGIREAQIAIENAFKSVLDESYSFRDFADEKAFLSELSDAVANDSIIVLSAEPRLYKAFKSFVVNAFALKTKTNKDIARVMMDVHPEFDDEFISTHADIPVGAVPLISQDGLYSGFGIKAKKQLLIVLPLDDKRIDHIINNYLYGFIRSNMDMSVLTADPLKDVGSKKAVSRPSQSRQLYDVKLIKETLKKLSAKGLTVAVANTKTIDFLGTISTTSVDLSKTIFISDYTCDKGDMPAREYAINLANGALLNSSNSVGAALTKVMSVTAEDGTPQYFMYVCIADKENANIAKLMAEPGETPPQLIYKAIEEMFKMLGLWADTGYAIPQFTDEVVVRESVEAAESDAKISKMRLLTAILIGVSTGASVAISLLVQNIYGVFNI